MKAIVVREFGGPGVLKLEEVPDPSPARGQVLVRVKALGVNPVDTYIRSGTYARKPTLPYTPGTDFAGTEGLSTSDCGTMAILVTGANALRTSQGIDLRTRCMDVVVEGDR